MENVACSCTTSSRFYPCVPMMLRRRCFLLRVRGPSSVDCLSGKEPISVPLKGFLSWKGERRAAEGWAIRYTKRSSWRLHRVVKKRATLCTKTATRMHVRAHRFPHRLPAALLSCRCHRRRRVSSGNRRWSHARAVLFFVREDHTTFGRPHCRIRYRHIIGDLRIQIWHLCATLRASRQRLGVPRLSAFPPTRRVFSRLVGRLTRTSVVSTYVSWPPLNTHLDRL